MRLLASSTMSWKRRSSSFGVSSGMCGCYPSSAGMRVADSFGGILPGDAVEREHERPFVMGRLDDIANVDQQPAGVERIRRDQHFGDIDARLPHLQRVLNVVAGQAGGRRFVGSKDQIVNPAPEFWTHDALPDRCEQDHADRLFDVPLLTRQGNAAARVDSRRKRPSGANYVYPFADSHACPPLSNLDHGALDFGHAAAVKRE